MYLVSTWRGRWSVALIAAIAAVGFALILSSAPTAGA